MSVGTRIVTAQDAICMGCCPLEASSLVKCLSFYWPEAWTLWRAKSGVSAKKALDVSISFSWLE